MSHLIQTMALNPIEFPLHGARLIEASAGTGKTYTITNLYLRLLLGHGNEFSRHNRVLTVDEILVVTFTEAATMELKGRIRDRITQAYQAFLTHEGQNDPFISQLLADIGDHEAASQVLLAAQRQMDEAAIYTIHGFCQRMLTSHAFYSRSDLDLTILTNQAQLQLEVVQDYWRRYFYSLSLPLTKIVQSFWKSPQDLYQELAPFLDHDSFELAHSQASTIEWENLYQNYLSHLQKIKKMWIESVDDILAIIEKSAVDKRSYSKRFLPTWLSQITQWANSDEDMLTTKELETLTRFAQSTLNQKVDLKKSTDTKTPKPVPKHIVFEQIDAFIHHQVDFHLYMKQHALKTCQQMLSETKQNDGLMSFNDLLTRLEDALIYDASNALENNESFAQVIAQQYPVAMIDEFQDTDPVQYYIFKQIYLAQTQAAWLMIGDPKQAIYGFRGADIFTYMKARQEVAQHYTLTTNWRSSSEMIHAVNHLFLSLDDPFLFKPDIDFIEINSSPNADEMGWYFNEQKQTAMQIWGLTDSSSSTKNGETKPVSSSDYQQRMALNTAQKIAEILNQSLVNQAYLINKKQEKKPISPGNIAILVRNKLEAALMKKTLAKCQISSVYLSNNESVFQSNTAKDLLKLLEACAMPESSQRLRAAIGCQLLRQNMAQLDALNHHEDEWESLFQEFKQYQKVWQHKGIQAMLRAFIRQREIGQLWLSELEGERVMTDLLHLGEILQEASLTLKTEQALIRWLFEQISQAMDENVYVQRLESEQDLVKIITLHKSKGLEYDFVFLPFVCGFRKAKGDKFFDPKSQKTMLDFAKNSANEQQAEFERLAEDLRLLYVGVTRAVYACFIGVAPTSKQAKSNKNSEEKSFYPSAMEAILFKHQALTPNEFNDVCQTLAQTSSMLAPKSLTDNNSITNQGQQSIDYQAQELNLEQEIDLPIYQGKFRQIPNLSAKPFLAQINRQWRMTSYSSLVLQGQTHQISIDKATAYSALSLESPQLDLETEFDKKLDSNLNISTQVVSPEEVETFVQLKGSSNQVPVQTDLFGQADLLNQAMPSVVTKTQQVKAKEGVGAYLKEKSQEADASQALTSQLELSIFDFPKGAAAGTFLHTLFEQIDFDLNLQSERTQVIQSLLLQSQYHEHWDLVLTDLVEQTLQTSFYAKDVNHHEAIQFCLHEISSQSRLVEMEFLMPVQGLESSSLNALIQRYDPLSKQAGELCFETASGMLKGFIDLIFEHQGKYYILDWKSNYLGAHQDDYSFENIQQAMIEHRYDFQYQIYTLALHRFLKTRLPDYQYETHFGGVFYVFLRGIGKDKMGEAPPPNHSLFYTKPNEDLINKLDLLFQHESPQDNG